MKIIQIGTEQCPPCKIYKKKFENNTTGLDYEYVDLYDGVPQEHGDFTWENYNNITSKNLLLTLEKYKVNFKTIPAFILVNGNETSLLLMNEVDKLISEYSNA